jgi:hypothetical protein
MDALALGLSGVEAAAADAIYLAAISGGTSFAGSGGAMVGLEFAFMADVAIAGSGLLGTAENVLGGTSLVATFFSDLLAGNFVLDVSGGQVGVGQDTVVTGVHMALGLVPESNWDLLVSASQLAYDLDIHPYISSGDTIMIFGD